MPQGPSRAETTRLFEIARAARPAAFCELVGAVTAYVMTGEKPGLRADLPPRELLAACDGTLGG